MNDNFYPGGGYSQYNNTVGGFDSTWLIVSAVLAIVGGIVLYFLFVGKKNKGEYTGFLAQLHDFLNFKMYFIEVILKVMYLITAIFITLGSFSLIGTSVASFFLMITVGNVVARITYELILMTLTVVSNTSEINKKLGNKEIKKEEKPKKKIATEKKEEEK